MKGAVFSDCEKYRYLLLRKWGQGPMYCFIGLNPSTADAFKDDATVRSCIRLAKNWGCGGIWLANLFAYRATDPKDMKYVDNPIGDENDYWIEFAVKNSKVIIASWGNHGDYKGRAKTVISQINPLMCMGVNKNGSPVHPLYQKSDTPIKIFN